MTSLAKSLKELYNMGTISLEKIDSMKNEIPLTQEEYDFILFLEDNNNEYKQYYEIVNPELIGGV